MAIWSNNSLLQENRKQGKRQKKQLMFLYCENKFRKPLKQYDVGPLDKKKHYF